MPMKAAVLRAVLIFMAGFLLFPYASFVLVNAAPGQLDLQFGTLGKVFIPFNAHPRRIRIQADGKILTLGSLYAYDYTSVIIRNNVDGTLDHTFGDGGFVIFHLGSDSAAYGISDFVIQSDGKLVVAGSAGDLVLLRFDSVGALDPSFGQNGRVLTHVPVQGNMGTGAERIVLEPNGNILVTGEAYLNYNDDYYSVLVRYKADGVPDASFGTNGIVIGTHMNTGGRDLLIQSDGKVLDCGNGAMLRYDAGGAPDRSFGVDGIVATTQGDTRTSLQSDDKIVVGGFARGSGGVIQRFNSDGTPDNSFGLYATVFLPRDSTPTSSFVGQARDVLIQNDGKIIAAGQRDSNFAVARLNQNGTLDSTFGLNGYASSRFGDAAGTGHIWAITLQSDGKIVAVGDFLTTNPVGFNNYYGIGITRFLGDGVNNDRKRRMVSPDIDTRKGFSQTGWLSTY
jgi:uncharacterized delta-60 repeat protein